MRYRFIHTEKAIFPVLVMCRVLLVSRSGYYAWLMRPRSARDRHTERLAMRVRTIHARTRRRYGSPRIHRELLAAGERVGENRVARIMRCEGLRSVPKRRFRVTTQSNHSHPVAENVLQRNFKTEAPNRVWTGDITYLWTDEGWLYLAVLLDLFSRRIVGWAISTRINEELARAALEDAWRKRPVCGPLIHHTDRGSQYASQGYSELIRKIRATPSMSRRGDCWDNAVTESFFATLKKELIYTQRWESREEMCAAVADYIENFYNTQRRHSTLGYVSPVEFELSHGM